jgi:hypothetical protein
MFRALHRENDTEAQIDYLTGTDLAQSTAFQNLNLGTGSGADENLAGSLTLFNPSSTTYVKHFISNTNTYRDFDASHNAFVAGYGNTTSAINAVQFKMSSGNMDGTILLYGIV